MASTRTLAVVVGSAAAAITFAVVSIVGAATARPDLGGPVIVQVEPAATPPDISVDDGDGN